MRKIIGIGETILDIIFRENRPYAAVPGGSVFNALVSLGRLGKEVLFISELGKDYVGNLIRSFMEENHISTQYIDFFPDGKSPISLAFLDERQNAHYTFYKSFPSQRLDVPFPPINEDDIFIMGSYFCIDPALRKRVREFIEYAAERRAIIYYDPNFRKAHLHEAIHLTPTLLENFEFADIIRGSDEDFENLFQESEVDKVYEEHIRVYCKNFLMTRGSKGVELRTKRVKAHFDTPFIQPVSTIGAGDNFNAGILYGLLKYDIRKADLDTLGEADWQKIVRCGLDLASEVCQQIDNYVSPDFAKNYQL